MRKVVASVHPSRMLSRGSHTVSGVSGPPGAAAAPLHGPKGTMMGSPINTLYRGLVPMLQFSIQRLPLQCRRWPLLRRAPCLTHRAVHSAETNVVSIEPPQAPESSAAPRLPSASQPLKRSRQPFDYTTLAACCSELSQTWVPARVEEVTCSRLGRVHRVPCSAIAPTPTPMPWSCRWCSLTRSH
jgi:hypothetical protein